jgi:hypothetical protein
MRIVLLAALAALAAGASAQINPSADTLCDPKSNPYDAVTAAPDQHNVLFEDEHVRVLEILLPPLSIEPIHIHALPSVIMGETGGAGGAKFLYREYRFANGRFVETAQNEVEPTPGYRTVWTGPEGPHSISNVGPVPVRFTRIEIKPEACARR